MEQDDLHKVELPAIAQLSLLGWQYIAGSKLTLGSSKLSSPCYIIDIVVAH